MGSLLSSLVSSWFFFIVALYEMQRYETSRFIRIVPGFVSVLSEFLTYVRSVSFVSRYAVYGILFGYLVLLPSVSRKLVLGRSPAVSSCGLLYSSDRFGAKGARSIVTVLWIPCSSMFSVCGFTLMMRNVAGVRGISLLYEDVFMFFAFPSEVAVSGSLSIETICSGVNTNIWRTIAS